MHPEMAQRSCADCQQYLYMDKGPGQFGERIERPRGKPVKRPKDVKPPCQWCPKVPPNDPPRPESAQELTDKNLAALVHYRECKAVGEFPADGIVRRNAAVIKQIEDDAADVRATTTQLRLIAKMKG